MPIVLSHRFDRLVLWFALLACLLGALMPTVLHIASATQNGQVVAMCSGLGIKQVQIAGNVSRPQALVEHAGDDRCIFCLASCQALASAQMERTFSAPAVITKLFFDPQVFARLFDVGWPIAQPRAPPVFPVGSALSNTFG